MEDKEIEKEITKNIKAYLMKDKSEDFQAFNEERISFKFEKLDGMCNQNFLVTIIERGSNNILFQLIYKKFGKMSKAGDHILESCIIDYL